MKSFLLTGAAGFIGARTAQLLLEKGHAVCGVDNLNSYYDPRLKQHRLRALAGYPGFRFRKADIENAAALKKIFAASRFDAVINLAARAGVRYSMSHPDVYMTTNVLGTLNLLEMARQFKIKKFLLASTSSLYAGQKMPFKESLAVNTPISPYAASKKGAEALCYSYHYLYGIDISITRYFTVYGPAGRPDMSVFIFIKNIDEGKPVVVFGDGRQSRDFTYVDDIALGTVRALRPVGFKVINLGGNSPHSLKEMITLIEKYLGKKARITYRPFHKADIRATWADIHEARRTLKWAPDTSLPCGIRKTVEWYLANKAWLKNVNVIF
jgi:nucleoside-diphosphate-sugar epimerase